jgi:hypothetical protein
MKALGVFFLTISFWLLAHETRICAIQNTERHSAKLSCIKPYQIIISEIMADPVPQVMLPAVEYIEIYNRGDSAVNLTGWKLIIGNYERTFPFAIIGPGEYLIICGNDADSLFNKFGKTLLIGKMPPILNAGQVLTLKTFSGEVIHSLTFSDRWYNTGGKVEGGWSLEIIDPDNPCGGIENWHKSCDMRGGSPGTKNSVYAHNPDNQPPIILRATLPTDSTVLVHFSEPMDCSSVSSPWLYSVNNGLLHPKAVYPVEPDFATTVLKYSAPFKPECHYTLTLLHSLKDCAGNSISGNAVADFAISQSPESFDVVINEILFNTADSISEFIELYNRSEKVIDLSVFSIALADNQTGIIKKTVHFDKNPFILFPGSYVVLTNNTKRLPPGSYMHNPSVMVEQPNLFSLPDEEGFVVLLDTAFQTIDEFHYFEFMQSDLLSEPTGVSLERINPDNLSNDPENWHSASTTSGYATPGFRNSQMTLTNETWEVSLDPAVFSPDNDGVNDYVTLHLQLHEPGWTGTIAVFDIHGRKIKNLISNSMLGTDEYFIWDGKWADNRSADIGIYLIFGEFFSPSGKRRNFKKVIPLVRRL